MIQFEFHSVSAIPARGERGNEVGNIFEIILFAVTYRKTERHAVADFHVRNDLGFERVGGNKSAAAHFAVFGYKVECARVRFFPDVGGSRCGVALFVTERGSHYMLARTRFERKPVAIARIIVKPALLVERYGGVVSSVAFHPPAHDEFSAVRKRS